MLRRVPCDNRMLPATKRDLDGGTTPPRGDSMPPCHVPRCPCPGDGEIKQRQRYQKAYIDKLYNRNRNIVAWFLRSWGYWRGWEGLRASTHLFVCIARVVHVPRLALFLTSLCLSHTSLPPCGRWGLKVGSRAPCRCRLTAPWPPPVLRRSACTLART